MLLIPSNKMFILDIIYIFISASFISFFLHCPFLITIFSCFPLNIYTVIIPVSSSLFSVISGSAFIDSVFFYKRDIFPFPASSQVVCLIFYLFIYLFYVTL